jgi:hypothetical protein
MDVPGRLPLQVNEGILGVSSHERHQVPKCILIVDDSALIRGMIEEIERAIIAELNRIGYDAV